MNGRVYDPVLGRFLSADPNVDGVSDAQGYNRYSYVGNNPMNATDPSGYLKLKDLFMLSHYLNPAYWITPKLYRQYEPALRGIAVTAILSFFVGPTAAGAAGGAVSGFEGSLLNGGSVGDAFKAGVIGGAIGAATAYASSGIGRYFDNINSVSGEIGRAAAHGTVGGLVAEATGGEFRHGFYGSFAGSIGGSLAPKLGFANYSNRDYSAIAARTTFAAVVGGTASALGGGKFANGAVTSAFQHLFNAEAPKEFESVAETNALKFDGSEGKTLIVRSNTDMQDLGLYYTDAEMNAATNGNARVLLVDLFNSYLDDPAKFIRDAGFEGKKFDNIVLERHNGAKGEGSAKMVRLFSPNHALMKALTNNLAEGGRVWFNGCYGVQFFNNSPQYASGLKTTFGGAPIMAAPGYQGLLKTGLMSQAMTADGALRQNRYLNYQPY